MKRKKIPCHCNVVQLRCLVCEIIYHFAQNCPQTNSQNTFFLQEIVLFETDYDHLTKLRTLVSESRNAAILDSGATYTAAGEPWVNTYIDSLESRKGRSQVQRN